MRLPEASTSADCPSPTFAYVPIFLVGRRASLPQRLEKGRVDRDLKAELKAVLNGDD